MNVVDSSGWLEYFADGSNASAFAPVIEDADNVVVPAIVIFEVGRRMWQQRGEPAALTAMDALGQHRVVPLDADIAARSVAAGMMHKLAMADSIILATAEAVGATVWSQDRDFEGVPGVRFLPKPDGGSDNPGEPPPRSLRDLRGILRGTVNDFEREPDRDPRGG